MKFSSPEWGAGGVEGGATLPSAPGCIMLGNFAPMRVCFVLCGGRQRGRGRETGAPPTGRDSKKKKKKKITHREQHHLRRGNAGLPPLHLSCGF